MVEDENAVAIEHQDLEQKSEEKSITYLAEEPALGVKITKGDSDTENQTYKKHRLPEGLEIWKYVKMGGVTKC